MMVDPVYVIKQPEHITLTVIQVYDDYPKSKEQQSVIDMLAKDTDVVFIFSGRKEIDYKKFTTLHRANGYVICDDCTRSENLLGVVDYFREIYPNRYISYLFINDWDIIAEKDFRVLEKIHDWNASSLVCPLITIKRFSEESLANMYIPTYEKTWWGGIRKVYQKGCDFQTHYSTSNYIFMKDIVMKKILGKDKIEDYVLTFIDDDPKVMLASLMVDLGIKTIDRYEI